MSGVYYWKDPDGKHEWSDGSIHPIPHFLHTYAKKLREAYDASPAQYLNQVYNEVDYLMSNTVLRSNGARVWKTFNNAPQAMEQAEYAAYLSSLAGYYDRHGETTLATGTMTYALELARALHTSVSAGGVRSNNTDSCAAKTARLRPCFWFHSGLQTPLPATVLNQHLHAIINTLETYQHVSERPHLVAARHFNEAQSPCVVGLSTPAARVLCRLEDIAIGGLYQLAFSNGNNSAAPTRPPNMAQFMRRDTDALPYYWSYYNFNMSTRVMQNISAANTCHYHTHVLNLIASLRTYLDDKGPTLFWANTPVYNGATNGWRLDEALARLFEGGEAIGAAGSTKAVYQFYRSETGQYKFGANYQACPATGEVLSANSVSVYQDAFGL